ncbi:hypothetical protein MUU48_03955 [Scandinavium sp. H11S7]|uniref:hypothetical protein n=1 Tax=Scandinavium hiltneri TaxID=2926519 RepID=UPI0021655F9C|nr:hypothetical protein [Scandinavium hiltneri]MCS2156094.1 hypothetical protein [Scandinavium hiltneri]
MMQMFKYSHGEGERRCRIDYDGPVSGYCPTFSPLLTRLTPRLSRFATTTTLSQTWTRMGGLRHGD